jgi:hypothetical protein
MTTTIDSNATRTYIEQTLPNNAAHISAVTNALTTCQVELADSLNQIRTSIPKGKSDTGSLINQIARLTSSLARLIEAFAKLRGTITPSSEQISSSGADPSSDSIIDATPPKDAAGEDPTVSTDPAATLGDGGETSTSPTDSTLSADQTPEAINTGATESVLSPQDLGEILQSDTTAPATNSLSAPPDVSILPLPSAPVPKKPVAMGSPLSASGEFLWKPISDKDGKLAILLPKNLTGKVKSVTILNAQGTKTLQKGLYSGVGNGDREHFRFSKSGDAFPDGAIVLIALKDGSTKHLTIKDTSKRTTV